MAVILAIFIKKIPKIRTVNSETAPMARQLEVKKRLLEERLGRRLNNGWSKINDLVRPWQKHLSLKFKEFYQKLSALEEKYRHQAWRASFQDQVGQQQFISRLMAKAEILFKEENFAEAEKKYIEILGFDNKNVAAYKGLGELYLWQKDYEHAKETFEFLLNLGHFDPIVYHNLGFIASQKGDLKQAEHDFQKSLEIDSADIESYLSLARVYLNLDERQMAFETITKAASLEPNNPRVLDFLIEVSIIVRDKDAAYKAYLKLKEVNSENQKLSELKEQIDKL